MHSPSSWRHRLCQVAILALILVVVGSAHSSGIQGDRLAGGVRVISVEQIPEMDGQMCEIVPAGTSHTLYAALWRQQAAGRGVARPDEKATPAEVAQRKPVRILGDPYGNFSAVAVDLVNNEVILQDENHFRILVYDRTTNTPPTATLSEPKRIIHGDRTNLALNCAIYVDPKNGDVYTVNNDSIDSTVIFSRQANGNVAPDREVHTPHGTF